MTQAKKYKTSKAELRLLAAIGESFGDPLPRSCLDRFPVARRRELLLIWREKVIRAIEDKTHDVYENGNGLRISRTIGALSSIYGKIE